MGYKREDPDKREIRLQLENDRRAREEKSLAYRRELAVRILQLVRPLKSLNLSKLMALDVDQLTAIGKAVAAAREEVKKANVNTDY